MKQQNLNGIIVHSNNKLPTDITPMNVLFTLTGTYIVASKNDARQHHVRMASSTGFQECVGVTA